MAYHALPADPNGTFTARVVNYDVSDAADEALTASFDIESAMSVKTAYNPPILSTAVATLGQHDMLWLETISLNEGGDGVTSGGLAGVVTVEYYEV
jgi:hypothetical protein